MAGQPIDPSATDEHVSWSSLAFLLVTVLLTALILSASAISRDDLASTVVAVGGLAIVGMFMRDFVTSVTGVARARRMDR